jgi:hypothetical protein
MLMQRGSGASLFQGEEHEEMQELDLSRRGLRSGGGGGGIALTKAMRDFK